MAEVLAWESRFPIATQWTTVAYQRLTKGALKLRLESHGTVNILRVNGPCPRCDDDVSFSMIATAPILKIGAGARPGLLAARETPDYAEHYDVQCDCNGAHTDRPEGIISGCGILFHVIVTGLGQ